MTSDKCAEAMGYYQGDGVACDGEVPPMGACCIQAAGGWWVCEYTADCECDYQGGIFHPGTPCNKVQCEPPPSEEGCCCYEDQESGLWFLSELTPQKCEALGGNFAGGGVPCETDVSPMGAFWVDTYPEIDAENLPHKRLTDDVVVLSIDLQRLGDDALAAAAHAGPGSAGIVSRSSTTRIVARQSGNATAVLYWFRLHVIPASHARARGRMR